MTARQERACWLAISRLPGINPRRALRLQQMLGSGQAIWQASRSELQPLVGVSDERLEQLLATRLSLHPEGLLEKVERSGAWVTTWADQDYPPALRELFDPPIILCGWGSRLPVDRLRLAIVGARRMTSYGRQVVQGFMADLAPAQPVIISGLARGVDGQAHLSALEQGLITWAVLGSGFAQLYPAEHKPLAKRIVEAGGTVLSEYWPDEAPLAYHFPARNRIIAALAQTVLVVEADEQSGSLITVDHALDLGREVFAVPGNVTSRYSRGTNQLLKQGAGLAASAADLLTAWGLETARPQAAAALQMSALERHVWQRLDDQAISFDQLVQDLALAPGEVLAALTTLQLLGLVAVEAGQNYRRLARV